MEDGTKRRKEKKINKKVSSPSIVENQYAKSDGQINIKQHMMHKKLKHRSLSIEDLLKLSQHKHIVPDISSPKTPADTRQRSSSTGDEENAPRDSDRMDEQARETCISPKKRNRFWNFQDNVKPRVENTEGLASRIRTKFIEKFKFTDDVIAVSDQDYKNQGRRNSENSPSPQFVRRKSSDIKPEFRKQHRRNKSTTSSLTPDQISHKHRSQNSTSYLTPTQEKDSSHSLPTSPYPTTDPKRELMITAHKDVHSLNDLQNSSNSSNSSSYESSSLTIDEVPETPPNYPHKFTLKWFTQPTWCKYCGKFVWQPVGKQAYWCEAMCGYTVHKKCVRNASLLECHVALSRAIGTDVVGDLDEFGHQVGGHTKPGGKSAMLKEGGKMLKPLDVHEFEFYEMFSKIIKERKELGKDISFSQFFAKFYGVCSINEPNASNLTSLNSPPPPNTININLPILTNTSDSESENSFQNSTLKNYIKLQDLTNGLKHPCVCDLKIGKRGYDSRATTTKTIQQIAMCAFTTSSTLGFRMCGMRVYQKKNNTYLKRDKHWGGKLKVDNIQGALVQFLDNGEGVNYQLIHSWLPKLKKMRSWFESQKLFHFFSSSLLLIYDGSCSDIDCCPDMNNSDDVHVRTDVRLIDFAHTFPVENNQIDENFLFGLNSVINMLEDILEPTLKTLHQHLNRKPKPKILIRTDDWTEGGLRLGLANIFVPSILMNKDRKRELSAEALHDDKEKEKEKDKDKDKEKEKSKEKIEVKRNGSEKPTRKNYRKLMEKNLLVRVKGDDSEQKLEQICSALNIKYQPGQDKQLTAKYIVKALASPQQKD